MESITYGALIEARRQDMAAEGLSKKTISNSVAYLRCNLLELHGLSEQDVVGPELTDNFQVSLDEAKLAAKSNHRAVLSSLRKWRECFLTLRRSQTLPDRFDEALNALFVRDGLINHDGTYQTQIVGKAVNTKADNVRRWLTGERTPALRSLHIVRALERYFEVPSGALTSKLTGLWGSAGTTAGAANDLSELNDYGLITPDLTQSQIEEIRSLVNFKTAPAPPPGMERNESWRVRPYSEWGGQIYELACTSNGYCVSAAQTTGNILRYYGFLHREKGVPVERLSLAYIVNSTWVYEYILFIAERAGGKFTKTLTLLLHDFCSLAHPEWGFVSQSDFLSDRYPDQIPQSEWRSFCAQEREKIKKIIDDLQKGNALTRGRDPEQSIEHILRSEKPIDYLLLLDERIAADKPPKTAPSRYLLWMRDRLLIRLMITNPLRINHFKTMTWRPDNTGNLRQDPDGDWWLVFEPRQFKNHDSKAAKHKYQARLDPWVTELIEEYLEDVRPKLLGSESWDYVFLPQKNGSRSRGMILSLDRTIKSATKRYLSDVCAEGFRPHSFRHIIGTGMLKSGHSIDTVASALYDQPETVRREYGHLCAADGIGALGSHLSELLKGRAT